MGNYVHIFHYAHAPIGKPHNTNDHQNNRLVDLQQHYLDIRIVYLPQTISGYVHQPCAEVKLEADMSVKLSITIYK